MSRFLILLLSIAAAPVRAERVMIAVAANFTAPMKELARLFEDRTGHQAIVSFGSTGKLYAQIIHGAPFQVFLAADSERPAKLHQGDRAGPPFTYATGRLALWSANPDLVDKDGRVLQSAGIGRLAIANPKTAPYGVGAMQILQATGASGIREKQLVRGDNIAQTYQFVMTGNVPLGFVALSQVVDKEQGSLWIPPQSLYEPIHQAATLLHKGRGNPAATAFVEFLQSDTARAVIMRYGYALG